MKIKLLVRLGLCLLQLHVACLQASTPNLLKADRVIVIKHERKLTLMHAGAVLKSYSIALGTAPVGAKQRQGDHRTPEGLYILDSRNDHSHYYKAIHISYPNVGDRKRAARLGVSPGGDVFVYGLPNGYGYIGPAHRLHDWTDGCIAVTDAEIDEIWSLVPNGTPIEIKP
jgi:murein L,D-transpeptidase YafK